MTSNYFTVLIGHKRREIENLPEFICSLHEPHGDMDNPWIYFQNNVDIGWVLTEHGSKKNTWKDFIIGVFMYVCRNHEIRKLLKNLSPYDKGNKPAWPDADFSLENREQLYQFCIENCHVLGDFYFTILIHSPHFNAVEIKNELAPFNLQFEVYSCSLRG